MNPLSGSWIRVTAGTYSLGSWGALWAPMPPSTGARTNNAPTVTAWSDTDRNYAEVIAKLLKKGTYTKGGY